MKLFAIYDSKAEAYMQPWVSKNAGTAMRALQSAVDDPEHDFSRNAEDFALFELGSFDDISGTITAMVPIYCVIKLHELKRVFDKGPIVPQTGPVAELFKGNGEVVEHADG